MKVNIEKCRVSGRIIIVVLGNEEEKKEVMSRKNRLKGDKIFIENDLTWEERKTQERINKWAKEKKSEGGDIKIGIKKVRINGVWKFWDNMEKEGKEKEREEGKRG